MKVRSELQKSKVIVREESRDSFDTDIRQLWLFYVCFNCKNKYLSHKLSYLFVLILMFIFPPHLSDRCAKNAFKVKNLHSKIEKMHF